MSFLHCYFSRLVERFRRAAPSSREERGKERSTPFQLPPPSISSSHSTSQTSHTTTHTTHTHNVCTTYEYLWAPIHSMWQLRIGMEMHIHCTQTLLWVAIWLWVSIGHVPCAFKTGNSCLCLWWLPYSRKYWRALNLAVEPKIAIARLLADLNLAVRYRIAIHIYASRKFWRILNLAVVI